MASGKRSPYSWASCAAARRALFLSGWSQICFRWAAKRQAFRTFVELQAGVSPETFSGKIAGRVRESDKNTNIEPFVYPFKDVYLISLRRLFFG